MDTQRNQVRNRLIEILSAIAPNLILLTIFAITILSLIALVLSDVVTGQVTGEYLTTNKMFGLFTSLAGTGMLVACGFMLVYSGRKGDATTFIATLIVFILLQGADVYFDAMSVDIMRFGQIVFASTILSKPEALAHNVYRIFIGGISLVGEPLAVGSVAMFPILRVWLIGMLKPKEGTLERKPSNLPGGYSPVNGSRRPARSWKKMKAHGP